MINIITFINNFLVEVGTSTRNTCMRKIKHLLHYAYMNWIKLKGGRTIKLEPNEPNKIFIFGKTMIKGVVSFHGISQKNEDYYILCGIFSDCVCNEVLEVTIGGISIDPDKNGYSTNLQFNHNDKKFLKISTQMGKEGQQADPILVENFPNGITDSKGVINDVNRYKGIGKCIIFFQMLRGTNKENKHVWKYGHNIRANIKGINVFDPRDPTQSENNVSTWKWSDNSALVLAFLLISQYENSNDKDLYYKINLDALKIAANICDIKIKNVNGVEEKKYTCNGYVHSKEMFIDILNDVLNTMNGSLIEDGTGKLRILAGGKRSPEHIITDKNVSPKFLMCDIKKFSSNFINILQANVLYQDKDINQLNNIEIKEGVQHSFRKTNLNLRFVQGKERAKRIGKSILRQTQIKNIFQIEVFSSFYHYGDNPNFRLVKSEIIEIKSEKQMEYNGIYQIIEVEQDNFHFKIKAVEYIMD